MKEQELTLEEKKNALEAMVIAEVTLMHQYNIARQAITESDTGYPGVDGSFALNYIRQRIRQVEVDNLALAKEIEEEEKKNGTEKSAE